MTVSHLNNVDDYTETVAAVYEAAIAYRYGIATSAGVFDNDCSMSSQASLSERRSSMTLAFIATVSQAKSASASANAASLTPESFAAAFLVRAQHRALQCQFQQLNRFQESLLLLPHKRQLLNQQRRLLRVLLTNQLEDQPVQR